MNDITPKEASEILRHYTDLGYGVVIEGDDTAKIKQALSLASKTLANDTPYNQSDDLISRSALLNQIDTTDWSDVRLLVEDAPTVEPERPQGKWIQTEVIDDDSEYGVNGDASECSNCKHIENSHYWTTTYYNFCPNCGADMRKGGAE